MYQLPAQVWNLIAQQPEMQNPSMKALMSMNQEQMDSALQQQADTLTQNGVPDNVINAYQTMGPLLAENQAISSYIEKTGNSDLRKACPEVISAPEALAVAKQDYRLNEPEQQQLLQMLMQLEPMTSLNV